METTSKLWDLNCEVESSEKVNFLYNQSAPKLLLQGKRERDCRKVNAKRERGDEPRLNGDYSSTYMHTTHQWNT